MVNCCNETLLCSKQDTKLSINQSFESQDASKQLAVLCFRHKTAVIKCSNHWPTSFQATGHEFFNSKIRPKFPYKFQKQIIYASYNLFNRDGAYKSTGRKQHFLVVVLSRLPVTWRHREETAISASVSSKHSLECHTRKSKMCSKCFLTSNWFITTNVFFT